MTQEPPKMPQGYAVFARCGGGAFGTVWAAKDGDGQTRAIKVLSRTRLLDMKIPEEDAAKLYRDDAPKGHAHLVEIFAKFEEGDTIYYVMELADNASTKDGEYLPDTLARRLLKGPIPVEDCISITMKMLEGLASLHKCGIVHRDIKPDNIIFVNGEPKIADIGLVAPISVTLTIAGSVSFIPPDKLVLGSRSAISSDFDLYALGKTLYCMFTGNTPDLFPDSGPQSSPSNRWLNEIILKACDRRGLGGRFKSAHEFKLALASKRHNLEIGYTPRKWFAFAMKKWSQLHENAQVERQQLVLSRMRQFLAASDKKCFWASILEKELAEWKAMAEKGYPEAQFLYASCLCEGFFRFHKDLNQATDWFRKAADCGLVEAQCSLSLYERLGDWISDDTLKWLRKAAEQGDAEAQYELGVCYSNGVQGMPQDMNEAAKWFLKGAKSGYSLAQEAVANCYRNGIGIAKDQDEADRWSQKAYLEKARYRSGKDQPDYEITGHRWLYQAAKQGDGKAQCAWGLLCYEYNLYDSAAKWYVKAAMQGNMGAQYLLGLCYFNGLGLNQDHTEAAKCFLLAAKQGQIDAQRLLVSCYMTGCGVNKDVPAAIEWYKRIELSQGSFRKHPIVAKPMAGMEPCHME